MSRYIDEDAEVAKVQKEIERLKQKIKNHEPDRYDGWIDHDAQIKHYEAEIKDAEREIRMLNSYPTADVKPVVHGKWLHEGGGFWQCNQCGYGVEPWNNTNYCPCCGADMREKNCPGE